MNDLSSSDFAGLEHSHQQRVAVQQWAAQDDDCEREIPLRGLYLYVRNFLYVLSACVSFGVISYFWSLA